MTSWRNPRAGLETTSVSLTASEAELVEAGLWQVRANAQAEDQERELESLLRRVQRAQKRIETRERARHD